ncbi:MAG: hypothetical protein E7640_00880 [Ruminococcaceae bacterium]|nr:hypothetical protein [Oscillospiraceae bacterium]
MSKINEIYGNVKETAKATAKKTADKTKNIKNVATLRAKLNKLEIEAAEEYDTLGRIYYLQEVGKIDNREAIAVEIRYISDLNKQMNAIKAELREIKRAAEAEKAERRAAREAKKAGEEEAEEAAEQTEE